MAKRIVARRFRRTTMVFLFCLAMLVGIGCAQTGVAVTAMLAWLCLIPLLWTLRKRTFMTVVWVLLFGVSLGWWRGTVYMQKLAAYQPYFGHKVTLRAIAMQDGAYGKKSQMTFDANHIVIVDTGEDLKGKVSLSGFGLTAVFAGDEVTGTGKLYSSLGSYQGRMSYAELTLVSHHNSIVNDLRRKFTAGVESALPEPLASFGMGLLIGQRNNLPAVVSQSLLMVGLTHIIAVSGYNLTILLRSADKMTGKRSKRMATALSLALIGIFLLFAGTSASIVRAAIVSMLSILAGYYGREFKPLVLLTMSAAITAYAHPFYVWSDSGWYLSFLAFFGVMVLAPLIRRRWQWRWHDSLVVSVALESICAEIMTLPFVLHAFGQLSFIALPANVLVAALVPLAMLVTLIAGLAGMFIPAFVGWLAWPARIILTYMLDMVHLLSNIPHVFVQNYSFSWLQMLICYLLVIGLTMSLHFKLKHKNSKITDKKHNEELKIERSFQMVNNQT